jgi:hypothetical protein
MGWTCPQGKKTKIILTAAASPGIAGIQPQAAAVSAGTSVHSSQEARLPVRVRSLVCAWACAALLTFLSLSGNAPAQAAVPDAEVEGLQLPVWLVRGTKREPLALGTDLRTGDRIESGAGARVLLRLADGSTVKLGENARFTLDGLAHKRQGAGLLSATLGVLEGAFRFTTTAIYKFHGAREVQVRFATVTAGIRGTDLWGKSSDARDIVALIEGKVTLTRAGEAPVQMDQARTVYQAPRNAPSLPIEPITAEQLGLFAAETEITPGQGALGKGGRWRVYAARAPNQSEALTVYERVREAGFPATIEPVLVAGETVYQVRIGGLLSESDGTVLAVKLKAELGLREVSVSLN